MKNDGILKLPMLLLESNCFFFFCSKHVLVQAKSVDLGCQHPWITQF